MEVSLSINGVKQIHDVEPRTLLVQYIRESANLTGTNIGCDTSSCGACTVHLNGESIKSCTVLAAQVDGMEVKTIEGLAEPDGQLHPMQQAFHECHALQCGYCTPGMVMACVSLVEENEALTETEVRVERLALEIAEKTKDNSISDGKSPNGIAAAYLYVSSVLLGQNVLQRDVSSVAGVTEVTIRNRCKEILTSHKLKITLRPSLAKY